MEELADVVVISIAESADDAIAAVKSRDDWKLIVIDLFLKGGTGLEVLEACKGRHDWQHAVVLTNYATVDTRERCLQRGADAVFDKSTQLDEFLTYCAALAFAP